MVSKFSVACILALQQVGVVQGLLPRGEADGSDQANAKSLILIDDNDITLTLYHWNVKDKKTRPEDKPELKLQDYKAFDLWIEVMIDNLWFYANPDEWHGDLELVIKKPQMANVQFGFCIDTEGIKKKVEETTPGDDDEATTPEEVAAKFGEEPAAIEADVDDGIDPFAKFMNKNGDEDENQEEEIDTT